VLNHSLKTVQRVCLDTHSVAGSCWHRIASPVDMYARAVHYKDIAFLGSAHGVPAFLWSGWLDDDITWPTLYQTRCIQVHCIIVIKL
jgi:hypothetical protein